MKRVAEEIEPPLTRDMDPVLARKTDPGALYLEQREIFKILLNEYFK